MTLRRNISQFGSRRGWSGIEALVVIGIMALIAVLVYPFIGVRGEQGRMRAAWAQLGSLRTALDQYRSAFRVYPASGGEELFAALSMKVNGKTLLDEKLLAAWRGDSDADGRPEFVDPWGGPWIYFNAASYAIPKTYTMNGRTGPVKALRTDEGYVNPGTYQLWSCGANQVSEDGWGDDVAYREAETGTGTVTQPGAVKGKKK